MKKIIVLGSGCKKCVKTADLIAQQIALMQSDAEVEKDTSMESLLKYQVMSTPAVVIDGQLVHSGGVPAPDKIKQWLL